ncbi:MAG: hypothetical protein U1E51_28210 [Candidatus Binatia bacterium]|nr:hypothetical protein [Candidatus Binatia bacterium]
MNDHIFDRARQMAAQCPHPTTIREQLSILAKRRKRASKLGVLHPTRADRAAFNNVESPHYGWQDRADLQ